MSRNLKQVYDANAASSMLTTDLFYVARAPFTDADNFGITWDNTQKSITAVSTVTSGSWNANLISPIYGGTGVNNGSNTITTGAPVSLEGGLQIIGAYTPIFVNHANIIYNLPQVSSGILTSNLGGGLVNGTPKASVYMSTTQSIPASTYTKVSLDTVTFDTNSNFSVLNNRLTPTIPGYYFCNSNLVIELNDADSQVVFYCLLYKNGAPVRAGVSVSNDTPSIGNPSTGTNCSTLIYCNGSTDYIEVFAWQNAGGIRTILDNVATGTPCTFFDATLIV